MDRRQNLVQPTFYRWVEFSLAATKRCKRIFESNILYFCGGLCCHAVSEKDEERNSKLNDNKGAKNMVPRSSLVQFVVQNLGKCVC
jgi:hypothetical protein